MPTVDSMIGQAARDVMPVFRQVAVAGADGEVSGRDIAAAMRGKQRVSTSRPTPLAMLAAYEAAAEEGASEVVSIHLSSALSSTYDSACSAAAARVRRSSSKCLSGSRSR